MRINLAVAKNVVSEGSRNSRVCFASFLFFLVLQLKLPLEQICSFWLFSAAKVIFYFLFFRLYCCLCDCYPNEWTLIFPSQWPCLYVDPQDHHLADSELSLIMMNGSFLKEAPYLEHLLGLPKLFPDLK